MGSLLCRRMENISAYVIADAVHGSLEVGYAWKLRARSSMIGNGSAETIFTSELV